MEDRNRTLERLLAECTPAATGAWKVTGSLDREVSGLAQDSRAVAPGFVFFAIKGTAVDGHAYIDKAVQSGAVAVVCEQMPEHPQQDITYIQAQSSSLLMGHMASAFYGHPSRQLQLVGITGTNGKTTTVTLLYRLFRLLGYKAGLLSTIENRIDTRTVPSTHTTGDALEINALLRRMVDEGCDYAFMEVSSHAAVQNRIAGLNFRGAIFSNITRDHLDYHKTFDAYIKAKKLFFDRLPSTAFALVNADDRNGEVMLQNTKALCRTYSLRSPADFNVKVLEDSFSGLQLDMDGTEVCMRLVGRFNAYNLTAIYASAMLLGMDKTEVLRAMSCLTEAPGRFETLKSTEGNKLGIVDYAHTPDALQNVLSTIDSLRGEVRQVVCVVGCGGNRDTGKRPIMAQIACDLSDRLIITTDNPRFEDPQEIIDQMTAGLSPSQRAKTLCIADRKEAIKTACALAGSGDVILVAGKGHENYQEVKGVKHHFDDREVLAECLPAVWKNETDTDK
ncbi:MAG: UDP-N-acetylmuramoyl-L-alanyl-D-glutamate--2,6-diaminopimelate ligase [Bacteroides sp.]|nr:UDP-N-acetylmuramoyl-L-alanyl-D-glutamate--2,6-diaminopimelate ligase [Bacteroides sp.]